MYVKIVAMTGKMAVTLPKVLYRGYQEHRESQADARAIANMEKRLRHVVETDEAARAKNTICGHEAVAGVLPLDDSQGAALASSLAASTHGASESDIQQPMSQSGVPSVVCFVQREFKRIRKFYSSKRG